MDDIAILDSYRADTGKHELGFQGNRHPRFEDLPRAGCQHRWLVDLKTHTMADKFRLLAGTHEIALHSLLLHHLLRHEVEIGTGSADPAALLYCTDNID